MNVEQEMSKVEVFLLLRFGIPCSIFDIFLKNICLIQ